MIIYLDRDEVPELQKYDLCVIGAGAAGITIAKELANSSLNVALVESGDFKLDEQTQFLYRGKAKGNILGGNGYLYASRLRYFGGATNHWGGWCRPLDELDFQKKEWISDSGWPITSNTLQPYYRRAEKLVEINRFDDLDNKQFGWSSLDKTPYSIRAPFFQWSPPTRFGKKYRKDVTEAGNIDLFLNANLFNIRLTENKKRVKYLNICSLNNEKAEIQAKNVVLACGGIENPRILLNCRDDIKEGVGNQNGLVGRYFMEHPHYSRAGKLLAWDLVELGRFGKWNEFRKGELNGVRSARVFSLSEAAQRENRLLNISVELKNFGDPKEKSLSKPMATISEKFMGLDHFTTKPQTTGIYVRAEQAPRKSNFVSLSGEKDQLGLQRTYLSCEVSKNELNNYQKSLRMLARGLGLNRDARLRLDLNKYSEVHGGNHHMGTTRMSSNPKNGVVNADCKVHGIDNLYIAGSSVFPTGGFANPTLTIVTLAVRLADHLKNQVSYE